MDSPNIFTAKVANDVIARIEKLSPNSKAQWGEMNVGQMLAHCNVSYEMIYTDKHPKPNGVMKFILKAFVKKKVVGTANYSKNSPTAPAFVMTAEKEFESEKTRLINFINETQALGEDYFDGKESHSFGKLSKNEWNNMLFKHVDYHLGQFSA